MTAYANITAHRGADFVTTIFLSDDNSDPISLEDFVLKGQIRKTWSSTISYNIELTVKNTEDNIIDFVITRAETLKMTPGRYLYDVYAQNDSKGKTIKIIEGTLTLEPNITDFNDE